MARTNHQTKPAIIASMTVSPNYMAFSFHVAINVAWDSMAGFGRV